jgi:hypothetical protein
VLCCSGRWVIQSEIGWGLGRDIWNEKTDCVGTILEPLHDFPQCGSVLIKDANTNYDSYVQYLDFCERIHKEIAVTPTIVETAEVQNHKNFESIAFLFEDLVSGTGRKDLEDYRLASSPF